MTISKCFAFNFVDTSTINTENVETMPSKKLENTSIDTHKEVGDGTGELKEESVNFGMTSGTNFFSVSHIMEHSTKEEVDISHFEGAVTQNVVEVIKMVFNLTTKA